MIYLDPPYGIKFGSNWQVSTRKRDVKDGKEEDTTRQPEQIRPSATPGSWASIPTWPTCATGWSWRANCSPRAAASLCRSAMRMCIWCGVLWTRCLGVRTFCALITFRKDSGQQVDCLSPTYLTTCFGMQRIKNKSNIDNFIIERYWREGTRTYKWVELPDGCRRTTDTEDEISDQTLTTDARVFRPRQSNIQSARCYNSFSSSVLEGNTFPAKGDWKTNREGNEKTIRPDRLHPSGTISLHPISR